MVRGDISFDAQGTRLRGWLFTPDSAQKSVPLVVMAHGFTGTKEMTLDRYADVIAGKDISILVFDHRNTGASDGTPRFDIDPVAQWRDYSHAITYGQTLPGIDPSRIGIWGTSYSGGQVLAVAALDRRVKCVVTQVPLISGFENILQLAPITALNDIRAMINDDRKAQVGGAAPALVPICAADPAEPHLFPGRRTYDYFHTHKAANPSMAWENKVTIQSVQYLLEFDVTPYIERIAPTPMLMIVAADDVSTPTDIALRAYHKALDPKKLFIIPGDHYGSYLEAFDQTSAAARDWFAQHLL
jgi:fermentation-respiration switch protein FrsA (DUF1100 family)